METQNPNRRFSQTLRFRIAIFAAFVCGGVAVWVLADIQIQFEREEKIRLVSRMFEGELHRQKVQEWVGKQILELATEIRMLRQKLQDRQKQ